MANINFIATKKKTKIRSPQYRYGNGLVCFCGCYRCFRSLCVLGYICLDGIREEERDTGWRLVGRARATTRERAETEPNAPESRAKRQHRRGSETRDQHEHEFPLRSIDRSIVVPPDRFLVATNHRGSLLGGGSRRPIKVRGSPSYHEENTKPFPFFSLMA